MEVDTDWLLGNVTATRVGRVSQLPRAAAELLVEPGLGRAGAPIQGGYPPPYGFGPCYACS